MCTAQLGTCAGSCTADFSPPHDMHLPPNVKCDQAGYLKMALWEVLQSSCRCQLPWVITRRADQVFVRA
jgi:hypothetical protein